MVSLSFRKTFRKEYKISPTMEDRSGQMVRDQAPDAMLIAMA